jgi:hypothetical protein
VIDKYNYLLDHHRDSWCVLKGSPPHRLLLLEKELELVLEQELELGLGLEWGLNISKLD